MVNSHHTCLYHPGLYASFFLQELLQALGWWQGTGARHVIGNLQTASTTQAMAVSDNHLCLYHKNALGLAPATAAVGPPNQGTSDHQSVADSQHRSRACVVGPVL